MAADPDAGSDLPSGWSRVSRQYGEEFLRRAVSTKVPEVPIIIRAAPAAYPGAIEIQGRPLCDNHDNCSVWPPEDSLVYVITVLHILVQHGLTPADVTTMLSQVYYRKVRTVYGPQFHYTFIPIGPYKALSAWDPSTFLLGVQELYARSYATSRSESMDRKISYALGQHDEPMAHRLMPITAQRFPTPEYELPVRDHDDVASLGQFLNDANVPIEIKVLASMIASGPSNIELARKVAISLLYYEPLSETTPVPKIQAIALHLNHSNWAVLTESQSKRYLAACQLYLLELTEVDATKRLLTLIVHE